MESLSSVIFTVPRSLSSLLTAPLNDEAVRLSDSVDSALAADVFALLTTMFPESIWLVAFTVALFPLEDHPSLETSISTNF